jgi:HEAT repeat protein
MTMIQKKTLIMGFLAGLCVTMTAGCTAPSSGSAPSDDLQTQAIRYLHRGMIYPDNPAVRAQALEAAGEVLDVDVARQSIRKGLEDEHPSVRFAACMVLGRLRDGKSLPKLRTMVNDSDPSVRVGAYFALERLRVYSYRSTWRDALRKNPDAAVRRNAALAMGQLENKSVMPLLRMALAEDDDDGVRLQVAEALALMGDEDAINQFMRDSFGGLGFRQPFALLTLGKVADDRVVPVLEGRLRHAEYVEARLAAARGLGMHGYDDGYDLAIDSLDWDDFQRGTF